MRVFNLIWAGQAASLIGSSMTAFGLGVWVYLETGSPTYFATLILAASLPGLLVLPLAGALVDRWDRRRVMVLSDAGTALTPAGVVLLHATGALELWHVYAFVALGAVFKAFQWPAFSALVPQIVAKEDLGRANGRIGLAEAAGQVLGALGGGVLYGLVGLEGLLAVDLVTFLAAVGTVALSLRWLPAVPPSTAPAGPADGASAGSAAPSSRARRMRREMLEGWHYIRRRPGLLGLLVFFAANNLVMEMVIVLVPPLVLSSSDPAGLGVVNAVGWTGMVLCSVVISLTREPRHRVRAILTVAVCHAVLVVAMGANPEVWMLAAGMFGILGGYAVTNAVTATLWQVKTPREVQGRVFAIRRMAAWSAEPLAYGLAGPLAQFVAAPLVADGGALAGTAGRLTGTGDAGGIAMLFLMAGPALLAVVAVTYLRPRVRRLERELPDALDPVPAGPAPAPPGPGSGRPPQGDPPRNEPPRNEPPPDEPSQGKPSQGWRGER